MALVSVDKITTGCYFMFTEYVEAIMIYVITATAPKKIFFNLIRNLGSIYDSVEEIVYRCMDWEKQLNTLYFWKRVGFLGGSVFHNVFGDP